MSRHESPQEKRRAFEEEALPHMGRVFSAARRLLRSEAEAEDLAQETFLRAYRTFDGFEPGTNARAWLFTILYSVFANRLRRRRLEPEAQTDDELEVHSARIVAESAGGAPYAEPAATRAWRAGADVGAALERLPEASRAVVLMVDLEGFSYEEAASALDWPVGTVRSRLSRARRRLAAELVDYAREHGSIGSVER